MDKFDNCSHDKEQVLVAQYFSQLDPEEEQVIRQQKVTLDAEKELRRETKEEVQYRTPLDYFKEQKDRKLEHLISLDSVNMFENPNVQKNFGKARVICAREHLFIGSSLGHVLVVAKETTLVQGKRPDSARAAITAMDATKRYLLIGYEDGWFAVMDINSYQIVLQQKVLQCRILLIKKMWEGKKSSISFFLSDESGCCRIIYITRGILGYDYEMQLCLPQQMFPWVSASFIEEDTTRNWLSEGSILLLSSVSRFIAIQVYKDGDKKFNQIIDIDNPHLTSNEKCLYSFVTHGRAVFNQDESKLVTLLAWNSHLYFIYKKEDEYHLMKPLVFSNQLIHFCYFVAESILQVVTQTQSVYLINTSDLDMHSAKDILSVKHLYYNKHIKEAPFTALYQVKDDQYPIATCGFGVAGTKLFILVSNGVNIIKLNSWELAVDILITTKEWSNAMYLILSVGNLKYSPESYNIDQIEEKVLIIAKEYTKLIIDQLKVLLDKYGHWKYNINLPKIAELEMQRVRALVALLIDFLLRTSSKVLMREIYSAFKQFFRGSIELFCDEMLPYIQGGKVQKLQASGEVISEMIQYYKKNNEVNVIEKLVYGCDFKGCDTTPIVQVCLKEQLTKPLSHVCSYSREYMTALAKLWGMIMQSDIKDQIELGHSLLDYLFSILKDYQTHDIAENLQQIAYWLFDQNSLFILLSIDLPVTLRLIHAFYQKPLGAVIGTPVLLKAWNTILQVYEQLGSKKQNKLYEPQKKQHKTFAILLQTYQSLHYLYGLLPVTNLQSLFNSLLSDSSHVPLLPLDVLKFPEITRNDQQTLAYCLHYGYDHLLIALLTKFENHSLDLYDLANKASEFDYFSIAICEKQASYARALDLHIKLHQRTMSLGVVPRDVFKWLSDVLEKKPSPQLRERVLFHLGALIQMNAEQARWLVQKYFEASDLSIIGRLGSLPHLQLEYIQHLLRIDRKAQSDEILKLYVTLLCKLRPQDVLAEVRDHDYPMDEIIKICQDPQHDVPDALAHLLERSGAIKQAIKVKGNALARNLASQDRDTLISKLDDICSLCARNQQDDESGECWDTFAQKLIYLAFHKDTPMPQRMYLDDYIPNLFTRWAQSSNLELFLEQITTRYLYLSSLKLKQTFTQLYSTYRFLESIYQKINELYWKQAIVKHNMLTRLIGKGQTFVHGCYQCKQQAQDNQVFVALFCGHIFHLTCLRQNQKAIYHCPICVQTPNIYYAALLHLLKQKKRKLLGDDQINSHFLKILESGNEREIHLNVSQLKQKSNTDIRKDKLKRLAGFEKLRTKIIDDVRYK